MIATNYEELRVYQNALQAALRIFSITKIFPTDEQYSLTSQIRRSSRSVCANIAEAWRKRRYKAAFIAKLSDAESEACETRVWIEMANKCQYLNAEDMTKLKDDYDHIMRQLVLMINSPESWLIKS